MADLDDIVKTADRPSGQSAPLDAGKDAATQSQAEQPASGPWAYVKQCGRKLEDTVGMVMVGFIIKASGLYEHDYRAMVPKSQVPLKQIATTPETKRSTAGKVWAYAKRSAKKWPVDIVAFGAALTGVGVLNELVINNVAAYGLHATGLGDALGTVGLDGIYKHMSVADCVHTRVQNMKIYPLIGPIMDLRGLYQKHLWGITPESPKDRKYYTSNFCWSVLMASAFYVPTLIATGHDWKHVAALTVTRLAINAPYHSFISLPFVDYCEKKLGVYEARGRKTPAAPVSNPAAS